MTTLRPVLIVSMYYNCIVHNYIHTGEAVGISVGVFLAIIATAVVIILAIIGYSKYGDPG